MRSEPRLNKPNDWGVVPGDLHDELDARLAPEMLDGDESGLPADLVALAGQLRSESALLGATFPATPFAPPREVTPAKVAEPVTSAPSYAPRWIAGTLLVALIAVGCAWWAARSGSDVPPAVVPPVANANPPERAPLTVAMQPRDEINHSRAPDNSTPALILRDLSGPELEGLLDLLEQGAPEGTSGKPRLSI